MALDKKNVISMLVIFLLTLSILISNPLLRETSSGEKQKFAPTKQNLTRLEDPLKIKPDTTIAKFAFEDDVHKYKNMYSLISNGVFGDKQEKIEKNLISPHTRAMVLMGCYGNSPKLPENQESLKLMSNTSAFMLNLILQTWETEENKKDTKQSMQNSQIQNDRSMCSCMKDFATPVPLSCKDQLCTFDTCAAHSIMNYTWSSYSKPKHVNPMYLEFTKYREDLITNYNVNQTMKIAQLAQLDKNHEVMMIIQFVQKIIMKQDPDPTVQTFLNTLENQIGQMYSHNKLRTSKLDENFFQSYKDKHKETFRICTDNGVPAYQTKELVEIDSTRFWRLGVLFLLAGATIGVWKHRSTDSTKAPADPNLKIESEDWLQKVPTLVLLFVPASVVIGIVLAWSSIIRQTGGSPLIFAMILWFFFWVVLLSWFFYIAYKRVTKLSENEGDDLSHVVIQILQDVSIIGGLANMSVSLLLQRGESDEYVVMTSYIVFITLGFLQHMSNILRIMQQLQHSAASYATIPQNTGTPPMQAPGNAAEESGNAAAETDHGTSTYKIGYIRVLVAVLVGLGLMGYVMLASSSLQVWTDDVLYGYERVRVFAICALFIWIAFDVFYELFVAFGSANATQIAESLQHQHGMKLRWTSYLIIASLLVLHMQEHTKLCMSMGRCYVAEYFFTPTAGWL